MYVMRSRRTSRSMESDLDLCPSATTSLHCGHGRKDDCRLAIADACDDNPVGHVPEFIELERQDNVRRVANELLLIERAKEWLLERSDS